MFYLVTSHHVLQRNYIYYYIFSFSYRMSTSERRRYGFQRTSKEIRNERKLNKMQKWSEKLDSCDVVKLRTELRSMEKADFLLPRQKERKTLIERMIRDAELRKCVEGTAPISCEQRPNEDTQDNSSCSSRCDDIILSPRLGVGDGVLVTTPDHFIPRSLRKRCGGNNSQEGLKKRVKRAEEHLIANNSLEEDIDDFFDSL